MKTKPLMMAALLCAALSIVSCKKDASRQIIGSYTYKTGGTVTFEGETEASGLFPEQGQLHIVDSGDGHVILTFNDITGGADVATAVVDGNSVTIDGTFTKFVSISDNGILKEGAGRVKCSGSGKKYDNILILDLRYEGNIDTGLNTKKIMESDIHCVAQEN